MHPNFNVTEQRRPGNTARLSSAPIGLMVLSGLLVSGSTFAAPPSPPPNAGQTLQQLQAPSAPEAKPETPPLLPASRPAAKGGTATTRLSRLQFTGNVAVSDQLLSEVAGNLHDQVVTLAELRAAADKITRFYRHHGYLVARAYIPQQRVKQGVITIAIMEGTLSSVTVSNRSRVSNRQVNGVVEDHLVTGQPLKSKAANRALLLLRELPGVGEVHGRLQPGSEIGSTALHITTTAASRVNGHVALDNYGNRYTGRKRLSGAVSLPSLFGLGDELGIQAAISQHDGLDYGRIAWDAPVGHDGLRLGAAASNTRYELGEEFEDLDAHGNAVTGSLYGSYPILLTPSYRLQISASLEHRKLRDIVRVRDVNAKKHINAAVITLSGYNHDHFLWGGANAFRITNSAGNLTLDNVDATKHSPDTAGSYDKVKLSVTRLQQLPGKFSFYINGVAQWASKNLDSSEKLFLGGPFDVRAYPRGEGSGDEGWRVTMELHYQALPGLQFKLFHGEGGVTINRDPRTTGGDNHYHLAGTGIGIELDNLATNLTISLLAAWDNGGKPLSSDDEDPRVWTRIAYHF